MNKNAAALVAKARQEIRGIDVDQAAREVANDGFVVVDVREPGELTEQGRIPGSVHAPRGMLEFHADPETPYHLEPLQPTRPVLVYCAKGSRSALACLTLQQLGYREVVNLDGGFEAWRQAGHPIDQT